MIDKTLYTAVWNAMDQFPRLEWELDDGFNAIWYYFRDGQKCFQVGWINDEQEPMRGSHCIHVFYIHDGTRTSVRQYVSDYVLGEIGAGYYAHILEMMAQKLAVDYFKEKP